MDTEVTTSPKPIEKEEKEGLLPEGENFTSKQAEDDVYKKIIKKEIAIQKRAVREKFSLVARNNAHRTFSHFNEKLPLPELEKTLQSVNSVFPNWLKERKDFQRSFPRFAKEQVEHVALVEIAMLKEVKHRTSFDIEKTVRLLHNFEVLKHLPVELCEQLCKTLRIREYEEGRVVYKENEPMHCFYMILRGSIELYNKNEKIMKYKQECFGDEAITSGLDGLRTHEARAVSDSGKGGQTVLLEMNAHDYRSSLKLYYEGENLKLSTFLLKEVTLFKTWSKHKVYQIATFFEKRSFCHGQIIQKANNNVDELCIVRSGICEVQREIVYYRSNRWPKQNFEKTGNNGKFERDTDQSAGDSSEMSEHEVLTKRFVKSIQLAELHPGEYFGAEFLIHERKHTTVVARGPVEILVLNATHSRKLIPKKLVQQTTRSDMFASEDELKCKYERNQRLQKQYELLKLEALGPHYHERIRRNKLEEKVNAIKSKSTNGEANLLRAISHPVLSNRKRLERTKHHIMKSTSCLPVVS